MIHRLSDEVIDRIAAGEVVERPASVVKELIENAIDASASKIEVTIEGGGKKLIKVVDNGDGMTPADLQAAFLRHATSKLDNVEDLLHIASLGFRGEALASIGSVSHARIASRPRSLPEGAEVENKGGTVQPVRPAAVSSGTLVEIRNLFYNVPARLKFLRADATELSHIVETVTRFVLACPELEFRLVHNGRQVIAVENGVTPLGRIERCFGKELGAGLVPVLAGSGRIRITGHLGRPEIARRDMKRSYIFVNGRFVRDKIVHAAIRRAFRERIPDRFHPVYFLNLSLPPEEVDVNVHPMKLEVRFQDGTKVFAATLGMIEDAISAADRPTATSAGIVRETRRPGGFFRRREAPVSGAQQMEPVPAQRLKTVFGYTQREMQPEEERRVSLKSAGRFLQVLDTYLLFQIEDGVALVDQHAMHERVLFQKLREEYESGGVLLQSLLAFATLPVPAEWAHRMDEICLKLGHLGIRAEPAGAGSLKITAVPSLVKRADPADLASDVLDRLLSKNAESDIYLDLLHSMACKAAVKAGDSLHEEELAELVRSVENVDVATRCPHGRPTTIVLTRQELEEMFKRRGF